MAGRQAQVISTIYPYLKLEIKFKKHNLHCQAMIDTGFAGHAAIPRDMFNGDLGLPDFYLKWVLADGSELNAPVYHGIIGVVDLVSFPGLIVILGNDFMVGRGVLDRLKVTFDHGKKVIVEQ